jgi:hypothetical protein
VAVALSAGGVPFAFPGERDKPQISQITQISESEELTACKPDNVFGQNGAGRNPFPVQSESVSSVKSVVYFPFF